MGSGGSLGAGPGAPTGGFSNWGGTNTGPLSASFPFNPSPGQTFTDSQGDTWAYAPDMPGGWYSDPNAYLGPTNTGSGSRGVTSFGQTSGYGSAYGSGVSTPFSAPSGLGAGSWSSELKQSNPWAQAPTGYVGGKTSGPANPYNNNQFANVPKPMDVFETLKSTWDNIFAGVKLGTMAGVGVQPGGKTPSVSAAPPPSDSFQQHVGTLNYGTNPATGQSELLNVSPQTGLVSGDFRGQTPGQQLAAKLGSLIVSGKEVPNSAVQLIKSSTNNIVALALDHMEPEPVYQILMRAAAEGESLPVAPSTYQRFLETSPDMVGQLMDNPKLAQYYREPFVDATKAPLEKLMGWLPVNAGVAGRLSTKRNESIGITIGRDISAMRGRLLNELDMLGYAHAKKTEGGDISEVGASPLIANTVLSVIRNTDTPQQGKAIDAGYGIQVTYGGNNQWAITLPGPLYGPLGYSAQSYTQMVDFSNGVMGESGNPWSGNAANLQMLENARRTGGTTEIGPVIKADGSFTLGPRIQTVPGIGPEYSMMYSKSQGNPGEKERPDTTDPATVYAEMIATSGWSDAIKAFFIKSNIYSKIKGLWQDEAPNTPFNAWLASFDWQTFYNENYTTSSARRKPRLRSVSY